MQKDTIKKLLELDKQALATVSSWRMTHGCVLQDDDKMVALCDMPNYLSKNLGAVSEPEKAFANARFIVYAQKALKRNVQIIEQLLIELQQK